MTARFRAPKDPRENALFRRWLLRKADASARVRSALVAACADDPVFWIDAFVWQYNPNAAGSASTKLGPFVTWDFQADAVLRIDEAVRRRHDLLLEKSREMGVSWLILLTFAHRFLFRTMEKFLVISRNQEAVDRPEDPDCLFWKLDYALNLMPGWMTGTIRRRKMGMKSLKTRSAIYGQASTGKAGVGGRATAMMIDEFSQIDQGDEVQARTSDTTGCRIFCGTHVGTGTAFYRLSRNPAVKKLVLHWSQHPDKRRGAYRFDPHAQAVEVLDPTYKYPPDFQFVTDGRPTGGPHPGLRSPWYDKQVAKKPSQRDVAMDLDIDPQGSISQFFDALTVARLRQLAYPPLWTGTVHFDRARGKPLGLVPLAGGKLRLWVNPAGGKVAAHRYTMGGDISEGTGATPSCLTVFDVDTGEKVAEYADAHTSPQDLAPLACALAWVFADRAGNPARFAWEMHGPGLKFGKEVLKLDLPGVYFRIDQFREWSVKSDNPGWYPSNDNKLLLFQDYRHAITDRLFVNPSDLALAECLDYTYSKDGQRVLNSHEETTDDPSGARINHGDRVVADALAWMMAKDLPTARVIEEVARVEHPGSLEGRRNLYDRLARRQALWQ